MPRKLPAHVERNVVKGKTYLSFRRGKGARVRLPADPTSAAFQDAYAAALAGEVQSRPRGRAPAAAGTIDALVISYLRSPEYVELRETTKKGYASRIETIRTRHGHRPVAGLTADRIRKAFLDPYAGKPGARLAMLKMLRILIRHAIGTRLLRHDPSLGIKRPRTKEVRSWTEAELAQYEARWPIGTKQRLAFALMLYTGQRRSDVHRMTWGDVNGSNIRVVQQKTGEKLTIPLHRDLRPVLDDVDRQHLVIVATAYGKPFTVAGFGTFLRAAITAAGFGLDCKPHGLRKAAGRRLAEAGCSARQIMAVLGHKTLAEAERYTRDADQAALAADGIARQEGHRGNRVTQTAPAQFGEIPKTVGEAV